MNFRDILKKLSNKYIIATLVFAAVVIFFDQYNLFEQGKSYRKLRKVKKQVEYYDNEIQKQEQTLKDLKKDSALLEKVAREEHMMKRDDEVIYILDKK
ncbi:MAG: septum formation initiator family protein [Bacteroidales bacterium]|nr:septum formation initiator family protein [Bacteroidales bacterium]